MIQAKYDFAVVVALNEEAEYFRQVVTCGDPTRVSGQATAWPIVDTSWDAFGRGVLVSSGAMGIEPARASTETAISDLGVTLIANLGIAGRVADWLSIGDVVVPREVLDFTSGGKIGGDPGKAAFFHAPSQKHVKSALVGLAESFIQADSKITKTINGTLRKRFEHHPELWPHKGIKVVVKPIACVSAVGANDEYRLSIARAHRDIASMEMESVGVMSAIADRQVEFVSVRGISDGADFQKKAFELGLKDENRRFALEAAVLALEAMLNLRLEQDEPQTPGAGIERIYPAALLTESRLTEIRRFEALFSHLVYDSGGDLVAQPIAQISRILRDDNYREPIVLLGGKGVGKTTLMQCIHTQCSQADNGEIFLKGCLAILIRISSLEVWRDGVIDESRTQSRVEHAKERVSKIISAASGMVVVLIDGLNQTGAHRTPLVADLASEVERHDGVRLLLSAESEVDLRALYSYIPINIHTVFQILPMDIDNNRVPELVEQFAVINNIDSASEIIEDLRRKEVRTIDLFILSLFFWHFRGYPYRGLRSLAECYGLYCAGVLTEGTAKNRSEPAANLSAVATAAFEILISRGRKFGDLNEQATAKLVSSHASVTNFLVAHHIIGVLRKSKTSRSVAQLAKDLDYVFPADVNRFTKQMISADRSVERDVIDVIEIKHKKMTYLGRSHFAYLAGRVSPDRRNEMLSLLKQIAGPDVMHSGAMTQKTRLLRRSILISRSMLGEEQAANDYANILLSDVEESEFNCGFHLEYYGDAPFDPDGQMASRDDGTTPCDRTFARLIDRIRSGPPDLPSLIELLTLLALVQVRNLNRTLRPWHRQETLALLTGPRLANRHLLPPNVRGYVERIAEDLQMDDFRLATVLEEWGGLTQILRTGWLRRRRDAIGDAADFWKDVRIESVAEHLVGVLGLSEAFLTMNPKGEEIYDKNRIIRMLLIHDLAESRLGDLLSKYSNPSAEEVVLWKYAAFSTYRGIGDIWHIPQLLQEFNRGQTIEARIAKDLDRLQFVLQARVYSDGMSKIERDGCEAACKKITTATVRGIERLLRTYPPERRLNPPEPRLD